MKILYILPFILAACGTREKQSNVIEEKSDSTVVARITPRYVTPPLPNDSDDPAIWYNENDPSNSLILGTDKFEGTGGLYVYAVNGTLDTTLQAYPLDRPNNVDVAYGLPLSDSVVDIAVVAERISGSLRVFSLPGMVPVDGGGIPVFQDVAANEVMGIAMYTRPSDQAVFAIVSRKENPENADDYLYQYRLSGASGTVKGELVRKFGKFSGQAEIEAIAVDNELGYVYYSDEMYGVRKYYADPEMGNEELAVFGREGFTDDREGITIYKEDDGTGYILVSDQGANKFRVYPREGTPQDAHLHPEIVALDLSTLSSDGSEVSSRPFGDEFPEGIFVAMSDNRTFEIYDWRDLAEYIREAMKGNVAEQ